VYVGRLDPRKGVDTAVEALPHLPSEARLELIGGWDTREEQRLRALAAELGVESQVEFAGQRGRDEIAAAYAEADVVVFPVVWEEPWGLVPLEAMGRGRPVVATGRGGSADYLRDGENALLFEAGDAAALAAAVHRLAGDPELRERLRASGFETAPRYTEAGLNEAVEAALLAAAGRPQPAAVA
jgi:glycosyltransferase involved in cell wall biosynthesis